MKNPFDPDTSPWFGMVVITTFIGVCALVVWVLDKCEGYSP